MGIDLECCDKSLSFSYHYWNNIRLSIAKSFTKYLHEVVSTFIGNGEEGYEKYHFRPLHVDYDLTALFAEIPEDITVNDFLSRILYNYQTHDALICIGLSGIYYLLNKSDSDGFYSPGNCMDIVGLFKNIKEYIDTEAVPLEELTELFTYGFETRKGITIT